MGITVLGHKLQVILTITSLIMCAIMYLLNLRFNNLMWLSQNLFYIFAKSPLVFLIGKTGKF